MPPLWWPLAISSLVGKNDKMRQMATNTFGTRNFWIGMSRNSVGGFQWSDGSETSFQHWAPNEPSETWDGEIEDCTEVYDTGLWNDQVCGQKRPYMCQISRQYSNCVGIPDLDKQPCGFPGISEDECRRGLGCCYNPAETIQCFSPGRKKSGGMTAVGAGLLTSVIWAILAIAIIIFFLKR